jgi:hypothetical protein
MAGNQRWWWQLVPRWLRTSDQWLVPQIRTWQVRSQNRLTLMQARLSRWTYTTDKLVHRLWNGSTPDTAHGTVAFMITKEQRQQLYSMGYKNKAIDAMQPSEACEILATQRAPSSTQLRKSFLLEQHQKMHKHGALATPEDWDAVRASIIESTRPTAQHQQQSTTDQQHIVLPTSDSSNNNNNSNNNNSNNNNNNNNNNKSSSDSSSSSSSGALSLT